MNRKNRQKTLIMLMMTILCIIFLFPLFLMVLTSLKSLAEVKNSSFVWFPEELLFSNYTEAMQRGAWFTYFKNSFLITTATVVISLLLNSLAGYEFARIPFRGRSTLFFISLIGMMVPAQVTMIPVFINLKNLPFAGGNDLFGAGGTGLINTYVGLILPYIAGSFGVFLCRQFYMNFPVALDDAAKIDGCSRFGAYFKIYLPLSKPVLATLAVLKAVQTWNDYLWPLIMVGSDKQKTVQVAVISAFLGGTTREWHLLMAATTVIVLPLIILFLFAQKYFIEGVVTSGIKG